MDTTRTTPNKLNRTRAIWREGQRIFKPFFWCPRFSAIWFTLKKKEHLTSRGVHGSQRSNRDRLRAQSSSMPTEFMLSSQNPTTRHACQPQARTWAGGLHPNTAHHLSPSSVLSNKFSVHICWINYPLDDWCWMSVCDTVTAKKKTTTKNKW